LLGMRERALLLGGTLTVRQGPEGKGTCVEAVIPLPLTPEPEELDEDASV
jgi:signal transduction histidine kinase